MQGPMSEEGGSLGQPKKEPKRDGVVQLGHEVEELRKALVVERVWVENVEQEVAFLLGLTEKFHEDRVQAEARRLEVVLNEEWDRVQDLEAALWVERLRT